MIGEHIIMNAHNKELIASKFKILEDQCIALRELILEEVTDANARASIESGVFIRAAESSILNAKTRLGIYE